MMLDHAEINRSLAIRLVKENERFQNILDEHRKIISIAKEHDCWSVTALEDEKAFKGCRPANRYAVATWPAPFAFSVSSSGGGQPWRYKFKWELEISEPIQFLEETYGPSLVVIGGVGFEVVNTCLVGHIESVVKDKMTEALQNQSLTDIREKDTFPPKFWETAFRKHVKGVKFHLNRVILEPRREGSQDLEEVERQTFSKHGFDDRLSMGERQSLFLAHEERLADLQGNKTARETVRLRKNLDLAPEVSGKGQPDGMPDHQQEGLGRVDEYTIIRRLGSGGCGVVFLAQHSASGDAEFALKKMKTSMTEADVKRFVAQQNKLYEVSNARVVHTKQLHRVKSVNWYDETEQSPISVDDRLHVMEYIDGLSLDEWRGLHEASKVPKNLAVRLCKQIADVLDQLHENGIVHCDMKPSNIMIPRNACEKLGAIKLIDFDFATESCSVRYTRTGEKTVDGEIAGTFPYMAPEQFNQQSSRHSDQYALAIILYELITGCYPFSYAGVKTFDRYKKIAETGTPKRQDELLTSREQGVLLKAMSKKPEDRFSSCKEFIEHFELSGFGDSRLTRIQGTSFLIKGKRVGTRDVLNLGNDVSLDFMWCPPTRSAAWKLLSGDKDYFVMGSPVFEAERLPTEKQHRIVILNGFWVSKYPITERQYKWLMCHQAVDSSRPMVKLTWEEASHFCTQVNKGTKKIFPEGYSCQLPTSSQWEYACRAGSISMFNFGDEFSPEVAGIGLSNVPDIGQYPPNKWGIYDCHGTVWEMCRDMFKETCVVRGGAFDCNPEICRSASIKYSSRSKAKANMGFRVVITKD